MIEEAHYVLTITERHGGLSGDAYIHHTFETVLDDVDLDSFDDAMYLGSRFARFLVEAIDSDLTVRHTQVEDVTSTWSDDKD